MIFPTSLRHAFPEPAHFCIDRKQGHADYTFLHFFNPVLLETDGKLTEVPSNTVILYNIRTPQYFVSPTPLVHDWMHLQGDITPLLTDTNIQLDTPYFMNGTGFITNIIREMETEFYGDRHHREEILSSKLRELFLKLDRAIKGDATVDIDRATKDKFRHLRDMMFSQLHRKWTVAEMAQIVNFSESRFYTLYRSVYGISPTADLIQARIDHAKQLLSTGNRSIEEIAILSGYDSTSHFIRQFKANVGVSPLAYRRSTL